MALGSLRTTQDLHGRYGCPKPIVNRFSGGPAVNEFADVALSFVERTLKHQSMSDLIDDFQLVLAKFGFTRFMMTRLPPISADPEPLIIAHTWSPEWLDRYREQSYFWADPVSLFSFSSPRVFTWDHARSQLERTAVAARIESEAASIGMVDGVGFPLADMSSTQSVVSLATDRKIDLDHRMLALVQMICMHCEMRAVELLEPTARAFRPLSPREREVLRWIANGKSKWETSAILRTSEKTVDKQLTSIRAKLDATNTTQAVAKALRTRLITL